MKFISAFFLALAITLAWAQNDGKYQVKTNLRTGTFNIALTE